MHRIISKKTARHLSYLLPVLLATGCSQTAQKDHLGQSTSSKFSVFTRSSNANNGSGNKTEINSTNKQHSTVWDRMLSLYALPDIDHPRIDREINFYLKNPEYISRVQQRAEPYLYFILDEIEKKNMPGELALLPVVESAFRPDAKSPAQASGLWQFIPPTGRLYGLKQNSWFDGRRDVVQSTQAATSFLKDLSGNFNNDWLLALASYNAGPGNISNAIRRNEERGQPTDFWSLNLNDETSAYVPRLLAIAKIFANPEKYNINLHAIPNEPYFELVDIKSQLDLGKAAEMAQTPLEDFFKLNPGFNRWSTDPNGPHQLLIPVNKAPVFREKLAELPHHERINWQHHSVGKHETLKSIAQRHNTNVEEIAAVNHLDDINVESGKILLIPVSYKSIKGNDSSEVASAATVASPSSVTAQRKQESDVEASSKAHAANSHNHSARFSGDKDDVKADLKHGKKAAQKKGGEITLASAASLNDKHAGKDRHANHNEENAKQRDHGKPDSHVAKKAEVIAHGAKKINVAVADVKKMDMGKKPAAAKAGDRRKS